MSKKRYKRTKVDHTEFGSVILCSKCSWRTFAPTPATAWKMLAVHLKSTHRDANAASEALRMMKRRS